MTVPEAVTLLATVSGLEAETVTEPFEATTPDKARRIAEGIPGARLEVIPGAGHLSTLEQPDRINGLLQGFLDGLSRPA